MLHVIEVGADDALLERWCVCFAALHEADTGDRTDPGQLCRAVRAGSEPPGPVRWLTREDGAAGPAPAIDVGVGVALLRPNDASGFLRLYVEPSHRRRGHGAALLAAARQRARSVAS